MLNFQGPRGGFKSNGIDLKFSRLSYYTISNNQKKVRLISRRLGDLQHPSRGSREKQFNKQKLDPKRVHL